jgi:hypothetical protein
MAMNLCGRGDEDVFAVAEHLGGMFLGEEPGVQICGRQAVFDDLGAPFVTGARGGAEAVTGRRNS